MPDTGHCSVCGREVAVNAAGIPTRDHKRTITHREADEQGPAVEVTVDCRGSRRPSAEAAAAARSRRRT
jgi:hypothetical protein